ncbi:membrane protein DedA, SNARE-associated domain [Paraburkholderia steynii]|uniref:Membrane protein DedA, SNARE-associated domain n=1 Tax=Paraburkholderia steynii TaxID=1245441 RepID=A0A7Z7B9H6_9BURK|nr:VTT domain-containing protein [Paraburkholderia steynii]SDI28236.1 membrane protein DedA, SNARE-associated domain [Paraburkholderia steynii]
MVSHELLSRYGALIIFFNVLASSLGLPFPSITTLMTIAASIALAQQDLSHTLLQFGALFGAAVAGGIIGDLVWFLLGRRYGKRAFRRVIELSPSTQGSITTVERYFARWGTRVLVITRFVPGLSLVAVPLCGATAIRTRSFLLHDCISISIWACVGLLLGALLATHIDMLLSSILRFGWQVAFVAFTPALFVLYRWFARRLLSVGQQACAPTHTPLIVSSHII